MDIFRMRQDGDIGIGPFLLLLNVPWNFSNISFE